ncbi:hypothetical protein UCDDS831_g08026 [Diplodia seriata]|uniref:Uncharacterized protein n=1 Tax=Diplodia seriata TaxID=420778 RepID=A0A0G2DVS6_9PEZI|nr:hypothetical protein UCDDS831_g08026 [Diplodia seriata]
MQFRNRAVASASFAARPELERKLEEAASQITSLYASAATESNGSVEDGDPKQTSSDKATPLPETKPQPQPETTRQLHRTVDAEELTFGYRLEYIGADEETNDDDDTTACSPTALTLQPPFTYSFREPTFGARLERRALERAYHVLSTMSTTTTTIWPAAYQRLFCICRHFADHATLLALFAAVLRAPAIRPFSALTLHLGGAGQHFATTADLQQLVTRSRDDNVRTVRAALETLGLRSTPELEADASKYEGVWLDSQDVEKYLAALGVRVVDDGAGAASVAQVDVDGELLETVFSRADPEAPGEAVLRGLLDGDCEMAVASTSIGVPESQRPAAGLVRGVRPGVAVHVTEELGDLEWDRFCDFSTPWLAGPESPPPVDLSAASPGAFLRGRTLVLDLGKLTTALVRNAGCVGTSWGFRLEDVHAALRSAVIDVSGYPSAC